jgi:uncharacterized protein
MKPIERFSGAILKENYILEAVIGTGEKNSPNFGIYLDSYPWNRYAFSDSPQERKSDILRWLSFEVKYLPQNRVRPADSLTFITSRLSIDQEGNLTGIEPSDGFVYHTVLPNIDGTGPYYTLCYSPGTGHFKLPLESISEHILVMPDLKLTGSVHVDSSKARKLLEAHNLPREIDLAKTVEMYLTGRTPKGKPLTPDAILAQPLIPALAKK